jgi:hypothetical protein
MWSETTVSDATPLAKRLDRFTEAAVDDEIVVMRLDNGDFFSLSATSAEIWRLIDGTNDRNALIALLSQRFEDHEGKIAGDVDAFLAEIRGMGLLAD